ncbi:MAG TPA: response regulator [Pyrinomonadaceae bacterium]|nr:response regulator [Pyrinomonadaceae bacterium]
MTDKPEQKDRPVVLVVEDHEDTRFMLRMILEREGYVMLEAADGSEGVKTAISRRPDLVLMDSSLPRLDGLSATRLIREQESLRDVPIVILSGHIGAEFQAAARAAGCAAYLTKPLDFNEFRSTLTRLLPSYTRAV